MKSNMPFVCFLIYSSSTKVKTSLSQTFPLISRTWVCWKLVIQVKARAETEIRGHTSRFNVIRHLGNMNRLFLQIKAIDFEESCKPLVWIKYNFLGLGQLCWLFLRQIFCNRRNNICGNAVQETKLYSAFVAKASYCCLRALDLEISVYHQLFLATIVSQIVGRANG